jgi:hypothetical protein
VDLNDTITSTPDLMRAIMRGLRDAGCEVHVLTGCDEPSVTPEVQAKKLEQLGELNFVEGEDYDTAVAVSGPEKKVAQQKVNYMRHVGAVGLIDDRKRNIAAARKAGFLGLRHFDPKGKGN